MKKWILYFLTTLLVTTSSCHHLYRADIINKSNEDILLEVQFDKYGLEEYRGYPAYLPFLKSYPNYIGIHNISFDSVQLKSIYKISSNSSFPLESGEGNNPNFKFFKSIKIFRKDTIKLKE